MKTSPTQRSLKKLRSEGYLTAIVEHWNPFAKIRQDLYCFVDLLGLKENETLAVQTTTLTNQNVRIEKIKSHPNHKILKKAGWKIEVHAWRKLKSGWECKITKL
jgi:hypothetical protein